MLIEASQEDSAPIEQIAPVAAETRPAAEAAKRGHWTKGRNRGRNGGPYKPISPNQPNHSYGRQ